MESSSGKKRKRSSHHEKQSKARGIVEDFETDAGPYVLPVDVKMEELENDLPNDAPTVASNRDTESVNQSICWPGFLSEAQLDLLVSIKQLAMERFMSIKEDCLEEILPASALETIGILLDELVKDRVRKMVGVHTSSQGSEPSLESESGIP
eukprot:c17644_g1_i1 orf=256-711(+)